MTREPSRGYALSTGIEIDPCDPQYRENPGTFLRHKVDEALQQCDRVLAVAPHDVDALLRKAAIHLGP
jgi:CBS-domain-containing membrane protein